MNRFLIENYTLILTNETNNTAEKAADCAINGIKGLFV